MSSKINISKFTLEKHPEDYDDVFRVIDESAMKDIAYNVVVFSDKLVNPFYENNSSEMNIMIAIDMSRGQIHEMFFTPMRVAWAMNKTLNIMVTNLCSNQDAMVEHLKLVREVCGIPLTTP